MRGTAELGISASAAVNNVSRLVPIGDQGRDVLARFERIALGERLPGLLRTQLGDGSFEVELAGTTLRMALPPGMQPGQRIELSLLAREPRLTFSLQGKPAGGVQAEVSPAGRLIDVLLRPESAADGATRPLRQTVVEAARPVANAPLTQPAALAQALAQALSSSGLFYESHVAQWVNGSRSQAQLQQEPQFNWSAKNLARSDANSSQAKAADGLAAMTAPTAGATDVSASAGVQYGQTSELPMDPASEAAHMLRLQLETLEQGQVLWRGEAWPGLPMEWGVADGGGNADPAERSWQSVLRFHFEHLGTVSATINLCGSELQLSLRTESEGVAQRLRGAATDLADAMQAAGTPLHLMTVRREEAP